MKLVKYLDLNLTFNAPEIWVSGLREPGGLSYGEVLLKENRFNRLKDQMKEEMAEKFNAALDSVETESQIGEKLDPLFEKMFKSYFISDEVNEDILLKKANRNTLTAKLNDWSRQCAENIELVRRAPGIKIFHDRFKNVPCVIVASGPNLKNSIQKLKGLEKKCLIIALGPSMRPLVKRGIYPHFCNSHDANGPNPQKGWGGGPKFFNGVDASKTIGFFVNYVCPATVVSWKGRIVYYYVDDNSISTYKVMALACDSKDRPDGSFMKSKIIGGSCVAHTAMYAAINFGCNPITLIGLDLSFPDKVNSHFESDNAKRLDNQKLIDVFDIQGRKLKTNLAMMSYKIVFERMTPAMIIMHGVKFFNSTQDENGKPCGTVHTGLEPLGLDKFIERYCAKEHDILSKHIELYDSYLKEK